MGDIPGLTASASPSRAARWTAGELIAVGLLLAGGLMMRWAHPGRLAVEHFDEGVYASNLWFVEADPPQYPMRHLYAPPLTPKLIEWCQLLMGPGGVAPFLPNLLAGSFTLVLVWWAARDWFGPSAGLTALCLASYSDFHASYSRTALTDPMLGLWMIAGVIAFANAYRRLSVRWAVVAGLCCGMAWITKYNGWMTLGIGGGGVVAWWVLERPSRNIRAGRLWGLFALAVGIAFLCWSPVWWGLQDLGGYAAVAENHRGYLVRVGGWLGSLVQQAAKLHRYDSWASISALMVAIGIPAIGLAARWGAGVVSADRAECTMLGTESPAPHGTMAAASGFTWNRRRAAVVPFLAAALGVAALLSGVLALGTAGGLGLLSLAGLGLAWFAYRLGETSGGDATERNGAAPLLPVSLLLVWCIGLWLATPFYHPYPRLTLPWHLVSWLGSAALVGAAVRVFSPGGRPQCEVATEESAAQGLGEVHRLCRATGYAWIAAGGALLVGLLRSPSIEDSEGGIRTWENRTGVQQVAAQSAEWIEVSLDQIPATAPVAVVFVEANPALVYALNALAPQLRHPLIAAPVSESLRWQTNSSAPQFLIRRVREIDEANVESIADAADSSAVSPPLAYRRSLLVRLDDSSAVGAAPTASVVIHRGIVPPR